MNNLEKLLENPTYIILGAGASKAYQFPLWDDLKSKVLSFLESEIKTGGDLDRKSVCEKWQKLILENDAKPEEDRDTIDHIIETNSNNRVQRQIILNFIKRVLAECESNDLKTNTSGWIETLVMLYKSAIDNCKIQNDKAVVALLENTKVITLNYERCFEYHFYRPIYRHICYGEFKDPEFIVTNEGKLKSFFATRHPHGSIGAGQLEKIEGGTIDRVQCISKVKSGGYKGNVGAQSPYGRINFDVNLDMVGDDPLDENYKEINENIENNANCLVMGFSKTGLQGCRLNWSKFQKIYFFGSENFDFGRAVETIYDSSSSSKPDVQMVNWLGESA